jgi:hypothetical protein
MDPTSSAGEMIPFDHPDVAQIFGSVINILLNESDRGAVLVGACVVDSFLRKLFEHTFPSHMNKESRRALLDYPGPLSSTAAKANVALGTRLIHKNLHKAIHALRKLRNSVAHSLDDFSLENHQNIFREMSSIGEGIDELAEFGTQFMLMESTISKLLDADAKREPDERLFQSREDVIEKINAHLHDHLHTVDSMRKVNRRGQLGIIIGFMCALIVLRWQHIEKALPNDKVIH